MATVNLNELIQSYIRRRNTINLDLTTFSNQKTLASAQVSDLASWKSMQKVALNNEYKNIFATEYKDKYTDYTEIPEYQDEVAYLESYYEAHMEDLTSWEVQLDNQITTMNTELSEINAYVDSFKQMLSNNIKNDYNYGLGQ